MKLIRGISLFIAGLIIAALIAAAFMPETLMVKRSIVIERPVDKVFNHVADLNNWLAWNPWSAMDPEAAHTISTPSRGKGAQWSWEGEEIGKGNLVQEEIEENRMVRFTLAFEEPMQSTGTDLWQFESPDENSTKVTWSDEMQLDYPVGRLSALFIKPTLETQFESGLAKLKEVVEQGDRTQPAAPPVNAATPPANTPTVVSGT